MTLRLIAGLAFLLATACGVQSGAFTPQGFHHTRYAYDVKYADAGAGRLMPSTWQLDNYVRTEAGLRPKTSGFYQSSFEFDTDRDEKIDAVDSVPTFDLRFQKPKTGSVVWLRTIPAPTYHSRTAVYVLSRDYIAGIRSSGYELAHFGADEPASEFKFAVQILDMRPARLANCEAMALTLEVASVAELKASPNAKRMRVKLVLVRAGLIHRVPATTADFTTVLVAGYASSPDSFEDDERDFESLLGRITIDEHSGYQETAPSKDD